MKDRADDKLNLRQVKFGVMARHLQCPLLAVAIRGTKRNVSEKKRLKTQVWGTPAPGGTHGEVGGSV